MVAAAFFTILQVVAALLSCGARGQLFGKPVQTLQEFLGEPVGYRTGQSAGYGTGQSAGYGTGQLAGYGTGQSAGYGTPKPFLSVIRATVPDEDDSLEHGETAGKSSEEFGRDETSSERGDHAKEEGKSSETNYEGLKQAAIKGFRSTVGKNTYGFKHNPKKVRNQLNNNLQKSSDDSRRHSQKSPDSLSIVSEKSSDFFSQPDRSDWPEKGEDKFTNSFRDTNGDHKNRLQPEGFFNDEYTVEDDYTQSDADAHSESIELRQRHTTRDRHNSLHDFGTMLNFESSKSHGSDSNRYSEQGDFSSSQEHSGPVEDFTDSQRNFGTLTKLPESGNFNFHQDRDEQQNEFEFQKSSVVPEGHSNSDDFRRPETHSTSRDFSQGHDFEPVRHLVTENRLPSSEPSSNSDFKTVVNPHDQHGGREEFVFEPQRTTQHHREGYNTPKPYKRPPPTTPSPRHEQYPLVRPAYRGYGHGVTYLHPQRTAGQYGSSEHSLLGYNAAKHAPGAYSQVYRDSGVHSGPQHGQVGYSGYSPYGGTHGYRVPQLAYTGTAVHPDGNEHASAGYGGLGYSAAEYQGGYAGGYTGGYDSGYGGAGYPSEQGRLKGVKLHQITALPLYPDHGTGGYPGYGSPGYGSPGYVPPGYDSLEYVSPGHAPVEHALGYAAAGGYGLKRPEYAAEHVPVYYDDYRLSGRYAARPYRRADATNSEGPVTAASEQVDTVAAAASQQVATVAEASDTVAAMTAVEMVKEKEAE